MRRKLTIKAIIVLFFLVLFLYLLYPTLRFNYLLSKTGKQDLKIQHPKEYEKLLDNSIKLGLDLQGGMHVAMEVDVEELAKALAKNKDQRFEEAWEEARTISANEDRDFLTVFTQKLEEKGIDKRDFERIGSTHRLKHFSDLFSFQFTKQSSW